MKGMKLRTTLYDLIGIYMLIICVFEIYQIVFGPSKLVHVNDKLIKHALIQNNN
jgi:hypothetical protein